VANAADQRWTTRSLLDWTTGHFEKKGVESPRVSAEMLLAHVLEVPRLRLYMEQDRPATELERAAFRELVERAVANEPVDYLVGHAPFFSLDLHVDRRVLVPRPSTETLVEHVVQHARRTPGFKAPLIADIGTGSGAIAIALAKHVPNARVIATDIDPDALEVARANADRHDVADRIDFREGDLLGPLDGERLRYLVSNPPYIPDDEWDAVPPNVREHEPHRALRGGRDGLDCVRPLIEQAPAHLAEPGQLVIEIAAATRAKALDLANAQPRLAHAHVLPDHEKLPRVLVADKK